MLSIDNRQYQTYSVLRFNFSGLVKNVYPMRFTPTSCPICGKRLARNYIYAFQISEDECVKVKGAVCFSCDSFFSEWTPLLKWLQESNPYNHNRVRILSIYNKTPTPNSYKEFFRYHHVFRQYYLTNPNQIVVYSITYDRELANEKRLIIPYSSRIGIDLLRAEKQNSTSITLQDTPYMISRIEGKTIFDDATRAEVDYAIEKMQYAEGEAPSLTSKRTLYVYNGQIKCHERHHVDEYRASFDALSRNITFYVEYCHECDRFLMKYDDYKNYLERFHFFPVPIQTIGVQYRDEFSRAEASPLKLNGYSVDQRTGLLSKERQAILAYIISSGILSKRKVLDYLELFIRQAHNSPDMYLAVRKWTEDKEFVLDYAERDVPVVTIGKLEKR